jgi:ATP-dependent DNA helicase RecG
MSPPQNTDWKESWRDDHLHWVCGFANAEGGLEIGRNDAGAVVGLSDAPKLLGEHPSAPHNPIVAGAFFRRGDIETWGRGIRRIFEACRAAGEPEPRLRSLANDLWLEFPFAPEYLSAVGAAETKLTHNVSGEVTPEVTPEVACLLLVVSGEHTRRELQSTLKLRDDDHMREAYLLPALAAGVLEMTIPAKPNSRLQKYRLTAAGKRLATRPPAP